MLTKCVIQRKKNGEILINSTCEYGRGTLRMLSSLTTPTDLHTHTYTHIICLWLHFMEEKTQVNTLHHFPESQSQSVWCDLAANPIGLSRLHGHVVLV